jgi:hypothetical protein
MRTLALVLSLTLGGCFVVGDPNPPAPGGDPDLGSGVGGGGGGDLARMGSSTDMANHSVDMASTDLTSAGGTLAFGADCNLDADCMSGMCRQFQMGAIHKCTQPCTPATQATDCPNPPSTGTCTNNNYCKF